MMNPARSASISASLMAYEAWALVEVHHPRGLASFAIDAYIECGRVNTLLGEYAYACGILQLLAYPVDEPDTSRILSMRRFYQSMCQAEDATLLDVQTANLRLFGLSRHMGDDEYRELGLAVNQHLQGQ